MKYVALGVAAASCLFSVPAFAADPAATQTASSPHSCEAFYPRTALVTREAGTMVVAFVITEQGDVRSIHVTKPTGYDDLDAAGVNCVKTWRYAPATHAGKPVEADWKAELVWAAPLGGGAAGPQSNQPPLQFARRPRNCFTYYRVTPHQVAHIDGTTTVSYRVNNGAVTDVSVAHSSGNPDLDQYAVSCVSSWEYESSANRTTSINIPWKDVDPPLEHAPEN